TQENRTALVGIGTRLPALTLCEAIVHSFRRGLCRFMASTVQKALDCVRAHPIWLILFLLSGAQACFSQDKVQTPQQANARIQQLAQMSSPPTGEIPIGAGDVIHI